MHDELANISLYIYPAKKQGYRIQTRVPTTTPTGLVSLIIIIAFLHGRTNFTNQSASSSIENYVSCAHFRPFSDLIKWIRWIMYGRYLYGSNNRSALKFFITQNCLIETAEIVRSTFFLIKCFSASDLLCLHFPPV